MAITTLAQYRAAIKQSLTLGKNQQQTGQMALRPSTMFNRTGEPGAGSLDPGNTANGIVPVSTDAGYVKINPFSGLGYISKINATNTTDPAWFHLYDRVFLAGQYAASDDISLSSQPSYAARMPGGTDFVGTEIWVKTLASTTTPEILIEYTDQDGNAGHTTGAVPTPLTPLSNVCWQIPLANGDSGVQKIERVLFDAAWTGGNVMVLRPLWSGCIPAAGATTEHDMLKTGLVQIFQESALYLLVATASTLTGTGRMMIEVASG